MCKQYGAEEDAEGAAVAVADAELSLLVAFSFAAALALSADFTSSAAELSDAFADEEDVVSSPAKAAAYNTRESASRKRNARMAHSRLCSR